MSNPKKNIKNVRVDYKKSNIDFSSITSSPFDLFNIWIKQAFEVDKDNANAFVLSTVSKDLIPSSRVVLLRGFTEDGLVFFTNYNSQKSNDISVNSNVSANFFWPQLEKQIRISGTASKINKEKSDEYFSNRPLESKLGAIISNQSSVIPLDYDFIAKIKEYKSNNSCTSIIRPENWGGFIIKINLFEFWQGRPSRLHDRLCYNLENGKWKVNRKSP
jgi:pyridoxamine 5'-phosphate oxidase